MDLPALHGALSGDGSGGDAIAKMMKAELGVCKCVLVAADGVASELALDMTPEKRAVHEALGGSVTFLGQWEPLGVFLVTRRDDAGPELPKFTGKLPEPFGDADFRGAVLLTRTDDDGAPADFGLDEYEAFAAKAPEEWQARPPDEEEEEEAMENELLERAVAGWQQAKGRDPTDAEKATLLEKIREAIKAGREAEANEELEQEILAKVEEKFELDHGREPNDEEREGLLEEIRATLAGQNGSDDEASSDEESEDEEESDEEDEEEAEDGEAAEDHSAIKAALLASCLAKFEAAEGRPPTSDERAGLERTIDAKLAPENDAEGEALVVAKVVAHFTSVHGRAPAPEEVDAILAQLAEAEAEGGEAAEAEAEEAEGEEAEEEGGVDVVDAEGLLGELCELFEKNHGRAPTEAEVQQWKETLAEAAADAAGDAAPAASGPEGKQAPVVKRVSSDSEGAPPAKRAKVEKAA